MQKQQMQKQLTQKQPKQNNLFKQKGLITLDGSKPFIIIEIILQAEFVSYRKYPLLFCPHRAPLIHLQFHRKIPSYPE